MPPPVIITRRGSEGVICRRLVIGRGSVHQELESESEVKVGLVEDCFPCSAAADASWNRFLTAATRSGDSGERTGRETVDEWRYVTREG